MRYRNVAGVVRHLQGWRPDDTREGRDWTITAKASAYRPPAVSLRAHAAPIRDQGQLGSCGPNAALEGCGYLHTRSGGTDPQLSRLFLYYYARELEGSPPDEDSGTQIRLLMKALAVRGAPPETLWPYDTSRFSERPSAEAVAEALRHQILFYFRLSNLSTLCASIALGFPAVLGFRVPANMMSDHAAATGLVSYPAPGEAFEGGHAVLALGYDDATQLVCCANSWGDRWGDQGFFYLPYRMFDDGFVSDVWTIRSAMP